MKLGDMNRLPLRRTGRAVVIRCGDPSRTKTDPIVFVFDRDAFAAAVREYHRSMR